MPNPFELLGITLLCPLCEGEPILILGVNAMCGNKECKALFWRMDMSVDENIMHSQFVTLDNPDAPDID